MRRFNMLIEVGHPNRKGRPSEELIAFVYHFTANDNVQATDVANAKYFGRAFVKKGGQYFESDGKTPFRYGCTNKVIDQDSVTEVVPIGEYTPNAGDRQNPYNNGFKGQTKIAAEVFNHRQNYMTISYELCNNNNWPAVVDNAVEETVRDLIFIGKTPDQMLYFRHADLTGKPCPRAFVDDAKAWLDFKQRIIDRYKEVVEGLIIEETDALSVIQKIKEEAINAISSIIESTRAQLEKQSDTAYQLKAMLEGDKLLPEQARTSSFTAETTESLNLRSEPIVSKATLVKVMPKGSLVQVVGETEDGKWSIVYYKDFKGYAASRYLKK